MENISFRFNSNLFPTWEKNKKEFDRRKTPSVKEIFIRKMAVTSAWSSWEVANRRAPNKPTSIPSIGRKKPTTRKKWKPNLVMSFLP